MRHGAAYALGVTFQYVPDKENAWKNLIHLTRDQDRYMRRRAADALGAAFQYVPNKINAWTDLHKLINYQELVRATGGSLCIRRGLPIRL